MVAQEAQLAVIIGASKGIGLALTELLKKESYTVIAAVRKTTPELTAVGVEVVEGVDVTQDNGADALLAAVGDRRVGLLIIAAGSQEVDTVDTVTRDTVRSQFEVNALGPLFAVKALRPSLSKGAKVALISSKNGSVTEVDFTGGELYGYRMSKAALNIAGATLARDLKPEGTAVALIHPGVVNTVMLRTLRQKRGVPADKLTANTLTPDESAGKILKLINDLSLENSGSFWAADTGKVIGW